MVPQQLKSFLKIIFLLSEPTDDIKEIPHKQTPSPYTLINKEIELSEEHNTITSSEDDIDLSSAADIKPDSNSKQITSGIDFDLGHDIVNNQPGSTMAEHLPMYKGKQDKYSTQFGSTIGSDYSKNMNTADTSVTETINMKSMTLVRKAMGQNKWDKRMNISCNKKISLPTLSGDAPSVKAERRHTYHYDLRDLPIDLKMFKENHSHDTKSVNVVTAMNAFQRLAKTKSEKEAETFNKQEEKLRLYTTVYDILSGNMVNYHDYYQAKKAPSWKYPNSAELEAEHFRVKRNRTHRKGIRFRVWVKGLFNLKTNIHNQH